jgi:hypothetical protein
MRAGKVLDAGTPAALVARHARWAKVMFGAPAGSDGPAHLAHELRRLPGVGDVTFRGGQLVVHGDRACIAHVGAWLVAHGPVPPDLRVEVPDLEAALLALLDDSSDASHVEATLPPGNSQLTGASR